MTVQASTLPPLHVVYSAQAASVQATNGTQATAQLTVSPQAGAAATEQPPVPPEPPAGSDAPATAPTPIGYQLPGSDAIVPLPREQLSALEKRADELSDLIRNVQSRRASVAGELEDAKLDINRSGLEERLRFLDQRIMTIEQEIDANSSARTSLEAAYTTTARDGGNNSGSNSDQYDGLIAFAVLFPISLAIARAIWRRTSRRSVQAAIPQAEARFAQLEQSIDTVAVEIERVAEGQRYVTRLLREGQPIPDFTAGQAGEPVRVRSDVEDGR